MYLSNKALFFSDNCKMLLYDLNILKEINRFTGNSINDYKSIYCSKIIPQSNKVIYGGNDGKLNILEYSSLKPVGYFDINENEYSQNKTDENENRNLKVNCIELTPNYLVR